MRGTHTGMDTLTAPSPVPAEPATAPSAPPVPPAAPSAGGLHVCGSRPVDPNRKSPQAVLAWAKQISPLDENQPAVPVHTVTWMHGGYEKSEDIADEEALDDYNYEVDLTIGEIDTVLCEQNLTDEAVDVILDVIDACASDRVAEEVLASDAYFHEDTPLSAANEAKARQVAEHHGVDFGYDEVRAKGLVA